MPNRDDAEMHDCLNVGIDIRPREENTLAIGENGHLLALQMLLVLMAQRLF
jgi:hypothetical protein